MQTFCPTIDCIAISKRQAIGSNHTIDSFRILDQRISRQSAPIGGRHNNNPRTKFFPFCSIMFITVNAPCSRKGTCASNTCTVSDSRGGTGARSSSPPGSHTGPPQTSGSSALSQYTCNPSECNSTGKTRCWNGTGTVRS